MLVAEGLAERQGFVLRIKLPMFLAEKRTFFQAAQLPRGNSKDCSP
jgi:hypothetical protein